MEKVEEAVEKVQKLVDNFGGDRKEKIEEVMEELGEMYFSAPASSREQYHYSFPGGLALHSINVFKNLVKINEAFGLNLDLESMLVVALLHDLGKACDTTLKNPHYVEQTEDWRVNKLGENYTINKEGVFMTNHLRSVFVLHQLQFPLTAEEYAAIYLNDGQYLQENRPYALKEPDLAVALHMADRMALLLESKENA